MDANRESKNDKLILAGIIVVALLSGLGFWGYYASQQPEREEAFPASSSSSPTLVQDYRSKLKVTFTSDIYPPDIYQSNPRLRRYVGKIQNTGERIVTYARIHIVYLDKSANPVFEQFVSINATLKPNFIQEFQFGGLEVPTDWFGAVDHEITEFRFADAQKVEVLPHGRTESRLERPPLQQILFPF